jgi:hypothetical protein
MSWITINDKRANEDTDHVHTEICGPTEPYITPELGRKTPFS